MNIYQMYFVPRFDDTILHRDYVMMSWCNNITHVFSSFPGKALVHSREEVT